MPETNLKTECLVGVDVGATKIMAGVFQSDMKCLGRAKVSTKAHRGPRVVLERIVRCVQEALDGCDLELKQVTGIGIGAPGTIDPESGRVIFSPNLGWQNVALKEELQKQLAQPLFIGNDCQVCTLGIHRVEFQSRPKHLIGVFLGTGIGGGIVLNGKLYSGSNHTAGEIGHMILERDGPLCSCGKRGCFEALAGRNALFREIQRAIQAGQKSVLVEMLGEELEGLRSGDLRKAIRRGDALVRAVVRQAADYAGIAVSNLIHLYNPEVIVLGGGLIDQLADEIMPIIVRRATERALPGTTKGIQITASKLGDDAGIVGGAVLVRLQMQGRSPTFSRRSRKTGQGPNFPHD